jgi:hypothetical protein
MKLAAALLVFVATAAFAQSESRRGVIVGVVSDTALRPIAGADVAIAGSTVRITTDSLGRFRIINVPAGRFVLTARSIGRAPAANLIEVGANDTLNLSFTLETSAQLLSTVVVKERVLSKGLAGFDQRRKTGMGRFLTHEDIDAKRMNTIADLLRTTPGIHLEPTRTGGSTAVANGLSSCPLQVYLDGMPMSGANGTTMTEPFDLSYLPPPNQVAAIEIYSQSGDVPPTWLPQITIGWKGCGAILVWTAAG